MVQILNAVKMGDVRQLDGPPITCNYVEIKSKGFTGSTWLFIQCSLLEVSI